MNIPFENSKIMKENMSEREKKVSHFWEIFNIGSEFSKSQIPNPVVFTCQFTRLQYIYFRNKISFYLTRSMRSPSFSSRLQSKYLACCFIQVLTIMKPT